MCEKCPFSLQLVYLIFTEVTFIDIHRSIMPPIFAIWIPSSHFAMDLWRRLRIQDCFILAINSTSVISGLDLTTIEFEEDGQSTRICSRGVFLDNK